MTEHAPAKFLSGIDIPKTIGGVLAAITAAVLGSFLGVAGTLIGAAVASIVGSVGTELYTRFIHRGHSAIKSTFVTAPAAVGTPPVVVAEDEVPSEEEPAAEPAVPFKMRWGRIAGLAAAVFVLAMGSLTVFELISKQTIADAVGHKTSSSTTVGWVTGNNSDSKPTPAPSASTEPTAEPTGNQAPSIAPTTEPTAEPTDTTAPQQTGGTDQGTTPTEAPADGQTDQDGAATGTGQDGQTGTQQNGTDGTE